ncbi:ABC transporter transmembrane domain-containing protein [Prochlorococcus marinus]|uniref:ABC transporter transmembrane domain-containing protein n=1 Tax=Prochlorococcus marinus TaxID=1219 RepID=UPI0022B5C3FB|nr:ABC transporter transmembrane domain-containing protein [Prochlorococcus marinus]
MENNIKINLRSIEAFQNFDNSSIKEIEEKGEVINYPIGCTICPPDIIPNTISIILSGEARLLYKGKTAEHSISRLTSGTFIGLPSLLIVKGCDYVAASSSVLVLTISDSLILSLYNKEESFRNWCNEKIYICEAYRIANDLYQRNAKIEFSLKDSVELIRKNLNLKIINDNTVLNKKENKVYIVGSANIIDKAIGDLILVDEVIKTRGPLPARIFELPLSIYNKFNQNLENKIDIKNKENSDVETTLPIKNPENMISQSNVDFGQYTANKEFKLIKANGLVGEAIACLQMLAAELNLPYRSDAIEKILRDTIKRGKKPNIQLLGNITATMGLHSSTAKVNPKVANRIPRLSLISWKDSFALVKDSNAEFLEIVSPNEGIIRLHPNNFNENFDKGFIELLLVEKNEQTPEEKFGIKWLLPVINKYRGILLQVLLASFVVQLFGLANPLMIQVIIDKVISQRSLDTLQILGIALVFVTVLGGVISSLRTFLFAETTNRIDTRLGAEVIDHLLRLPLNYFDARPVGELGSRVAELEKIRNFLTGQALTTLLDAAFSLIYIIVMVIYSWLLTLIALGVVPIQIILTAIGTPLIRRQIRQVAEENAKTQSHLIEVITGIQTVKAQNVEKVSRWKWQERYSEYISKSFQKTITGTALGETSQVLQQLSQLLVLWIGASLVLNGQLTLGQLIAFRIISGYVTQPLLRLSTIWQNIQELRVSFERLADIIDTPEETTESDRAKIPLPSLEGSIQFEDISFRFKPGKPNVLKNINLEIKPGQFVGIVGQSGSGKSTLMKLLPRLYKPNTGRIKIDSYDIDKVELYSLRRQIGIVPQEPLLFAGTVSDNIALTDPEAASDEIVNVAKIADAHDFVMDLSDGYSTNIGERGAGLSGGQKQRIAIARTLLSNPKLLIMDEATSALDYETERKVCEGLRKSCKNSTVFFITHRLSTVRNADLIVMLHEGSITEMGTHNELMALKGRYFALYLQQESA